MHKKARTLCFALLVGLVCCSCTKTIPYDPNPSKVSGDPFQELERSLQREGMYTPAILEIGPEFVKIVYAGYGLVTYNIYFDNIGDSNLLCKRNKYCAVQVLKKDGSPVFRYHAIKQETAKHFIDVLYAARDAALSQPTAEEITPTSEIVN